MEAPQKLTKKQKKALAFRQRGKIGKRSSGENDLDEMEALALPIMEEQDDIASDGDTAQAGGNARKTRGEAGRDEIGDAKKREKGTGGRNGHNRGEKGAIRGSGEVVKEGKRKRDEEGDEKDEGVDGMGEGPREGASSKAKRRKVMENEKPEDPKRRERKQAEIKQRFILFVGNLKYTTTKDTIQAHFAQCDPPPSVRLLTPKSTNVPRNKSKGCAFVEFTHRNALQQGLKLHQSMLDGRMINVELTAGGGGKSDARLTKVKERNKALLDQRTQRSEKEAKQNDRLVVVPKPQRYSATSGVEQQIVAKRTWTVGDDESGLTHRGGVKHSKRGVKPKGKMWGTGVNAIPVS